MRLVIGTEHCILCSPRDPYQRGKHVVGNSRLLPPCACTEHDHERECDAGSEKFRHTLPPKLLADIGRIAFASGEGQKPTYRCAPALDYGSFKSRAGRSVAL